MPLLSTMFSLRRTACPAWLSILLAAVALGAFSPPAAEGHADLLRLIENLSQRIAASPTNAELYLLRGELYRTHTDWQLAEADYDRAGQLNPKLNGIELARGKLLFESGRPAEARTNLDRHLALQPTDVDGLVTRGQLLARLGEPRAAAADFTRAIAQSATPLPDYFLERARAEAAAGDSTKALAGLDEGLKRLGPLVALQLCALDLECAEKHFDRAIKRLETITDGSERKEKWLARRGEILVLAGRGEGARASFKAALEAIELLPPRQRSAPAMVELRRQVEAALGGIEPPKTVAGKR
jgi:tetratricopeptide (TPR) repeat protein